MNHYNKLLEGILRNTSKQKIQQVFSQLAKKNYHVNVKPLHNLPSPSYLPQNPRKFCQPFAPYDFFLSDKFGGKRGYAKYRFSHFKDNNNSTIIKGGGGGSRTEKYDVSVTNGGYGRSNGYGSSRRGFGYKSKEEKVTYFLRQIKLVGEIVWLLAQIIAVLTFGACGILYIFGLVIAIYYYLFFEDSEAEKELKEAEKRAKSRKGKSKSDY